MPRSGRSHWQRGPLSPGSKRVGTPFGEPARGLDGLSYGLGYVVSRTRRLSTTFFFFFFSSFFRMYVCFPWNLSANCFRSKRHTYPLYSHIILLCQRPGAIAFVKIGGQPIFILLRRRKQQEQQHLSAAATHADATTAAAAPADEHPQLQHGRSMRRPKKANITQVILKAAVLVVGSTTTHKMVHVAAAFGQKMSAVWAYLTKFAPASQNRAIT